MNKKVLVVGGAGFIGSNLVANLIKSGYKVTIYDNMSRKGVEKNLNWLKSLAKGNLEVTIADIRERELLDDAVKGQDAIYHLAGQVAVTTSVVYPYNDFEINLQGTINLLEAVRKNSPEALFLYSSTNKVYGSLEDIKLTEGKKTYSFTDIQYHKGIDEKRNLDFHSPYGCSKGAADQYIHDYARIYNLRTVVLRQSCIYGQRQFGSEDQGWLFHFLKLTFLNQKINIFGDGKQVRDVLYVQDLIDLYLEILKHPNKSTGMIFNVGGGYKNSISLLESLDKIRALTKKKPQVKFFPERPGDQKIFISDNSKLKQYLNWEPQTNIDKGLRLLYKWTSELIKG